MLYLKYYFLNYVYFTFILFVCLLVADDILDVTATSEELGKTAGKDEAVDKTTYVKLLGLEKSKSEALRLVAEAKQALAKYGDKALPLLGIADYIVERKN